MDDVLSVPWALHPTRRLIPGLAAETGLARSGLAASHRMKDGFHRWSHHVADALGSPVAFAIAVASIVIWAVTGPIFHFSDSWQLVVNTATTVVTFLMVFVVQNTQTRDTRALHLKLDELIRANRQARNALLALEERPEAELRKLTNEFEALREGEAPREK